MARTDANPPMPEFRDRLRPRRRSTPTTWPRRSSPSSSSTSTSPSASCARAASTSARGSASTWSPRRHRRGGRHRAARASTPATTWSSLIDDDVCTRCALCVDRCPTGRDHPRQARRPGRGRRRPPAHQHPWLRLRDAARMSATRTATDSWPRHDGRQEPRRAGRQKVWRAHRQGAGQPGLELDLPARLDLPEGLHRQPPEPVLRDHELGAVPPAPGEGEAPRGEGQLHALPRRPAASSCSSCSRSPASS